MPESFKRLSQLLSKRQRATIQVGISCGLLAYLCHYCTDQSLLSSYRQLKVAPFLLCIVTSLLQIQLSALKWFELAKLLAMTSRRKDFIWATWIASTLNQILPTTLVAEGQRFLFVKGENPSKKVILSQILDRVSVHLVWMIALLPCLPWILLEISKSWALAISSLISSLMIALLVGGGVLRFYQGSGDKQRLWRHARIVLNPLVVVQSFLIAGMVPFGLYCAGLSMGKTMLWQQLLLLSPLILMALAVPFFFSGWGVREAVLVYFAIPLGMTAEEAIVSSLTYGLAGLIAAPLGLSLLGAFSVCKIFIRRNENPKDCGELSTKG